MFEIAVNKQTNTSKENLTNTYKDKGASPRKGKDILSVIDLADNQRRSQTRFAVPNSPSCHKKLCVFGCTLVYNLGTFASPEAVTRWSLTMVREMRTKIDAVGAVTGNLSREIMRRIIDLLPRPAPA